MNKSDAVRKKCLECAGGSPKEVTLCHIVDCPLWPYRFGYSMNDKRFWKRMASAKKRSPKQYHEMILSLYEYVKDRPNLAKNEHIRSILLAERIDVYIKPFV
jgi:hypothetical protein